MALVEDDNFVQALPPNRTDDAVCGELLILAESATRHTQAPACLLQTEPRHNYRDLKTGTYRRPNANAIGYPHNGRDAATWWIDADQVQMPSNK